MRLLTLLEKQQQQQQPKNKQQHWPAFSSMNAFSRNLMQMLALVILSRAKMHPNT